MIPTNTMPLESLPTSDAAAFNFDGSKSFGRGSNLKHFNVTQLPRFAWVPRLTEMREIRAVIRWEDGSESTTEWISDHPGSDSATNAMLEAVLAIKRNYPERTISTVTRDERNIQVRATIAS